MGHCSFSIEKTGNCGNLRKKEEKKWEKYAIQLSELELPEQSIFFLCHGCDFYFDRIDQWMAGLPTAGEKYDSVSQGTAESQC